MTRPHDTTSLTIRLNPIQRQIIRDFLARCKASPDVFHAVLKKLRTGQAVEVSFDDLGRVVDALGPNGDACITCLRMAEVCPARDTGAEVRQGAPLAQLDGGADR